MIRTFDEKLNRLLPNAKCYLIPPAVDEKSSGRVKEVLGLFPEVEEDFLEFIAFLFKMFLMFFLGGSCFYPPSPIHLKSYIESSFNCSSIFLVSLFVRFLPLGSGWGYLLLGKEAGQGNFHSLS